ncbi:MULTISPECIES: hypothetical protein [Brevibacterium]|uniref:hypothetical protein n=1 Tax=Brevibacterium TaxID=1696 RepID=UPI001EF478BF|nr:hypothetical protein [Brevibacterium sp. ACRRH]MCG7299006.1 hypothetical protein [Brevibacterium sp. ACRRH]
MPTSIGDPAAGQRLNIPSLPKDAEIRINDGQYESRANPRPQSLGIIEIRSVRDLDRSATPLADRGLLGVGTLTVRRSERRAQKEVVGMPTLSLLDDACGMWES